MKKHVLYILLFVFFLIGCKTFNKKNTDEPEIKSAEVLNLLEKEGSEQKPRQDSIVNSKFEKMQMTAFGDLVFGMNKNQVEQNNENRQKLGKYLYNFTYSFDESDRLYEVILSSDPDKAINFDGQLKSKLNNLSSVVKTKYGQPARDLQYPSIFDVQETGNYFISEWDFEGKQIQLGLKENALNSYSVICNITDINLKENALKRLQDDKNRDIIDASEKF